MSEAFLIDPQRSVCLCNEGAEGHRISVALNAAGDEHFVVILDAAVNDVSVRYDAACTAVAHEQLGPLPPLWKSRTWLSPLRCGRPTKTTGAGCRNIVATPGSACRRHQKSSLAEELK